MYVPVNYCSDFKPSEISEKTRIYPRNRRKVNQREISHSPMIYSLKVNNIFTGRTPPRAFDDGYLDTSTRGLPSFGAMPYSVLVFFSSLFIWKLKVGSYHIEMILQIGSVG